MANRSMDDLQVLSETDLFLARSKSFSMENDSASAHEDHSWRYLTRTYSNNSKQLKSSKSTSSIPEDPARNYYRNLPGAMPISRNQVLTAQNANAPWLMNILKKKFHRSRKSKKDRSAFEEANSTRTMTNASMSLAEEFLERPLSHDGTGGKWIVSEREIVLPLVKDADVSAVGQYNISRAMSSSTSPITDDSLHVRHYQYDFQPSISASMSLVDHPSHISSIITDETEQQQQSVEDDFPTDFASIASAVRTYHRASRQRIQSLPAEGLQVSGPSLPSALEPITEDLPLASGNSTMQTTSKRAKSTSAAHTRRPPNSTSTKRGKRRSASTKKKKSKYYQEHLLTSDEIELREALRIIDLDNIGFFPPRELRKVLQEIGIRSNDIGKIERCLPLDEDGHYSIDNLVKLFLGSE